MSEGRQPFPVQHTLSTPAPPNQRLAPLGGLLDHVHRRAGLLDGLDGAYQAVIMHYAHARALTQRVCTHERVVARRRAGWRV